MKGVGGAVFFENDTHGIAFAFDAQKFRPRVDRDSIRPHAFFQSSRRIGIAAAQNLRAALNDGLLKSRQGVQFLPIFAWVSVSLLLAGMLAS